MTALTKVENIQDHSIDIMITNVEKMQEMARKLMQSKHYQKMGEEGIFAVCMAAKSNGISEIDALNGELYYVQGKVGMGYEAMNKYIRLAGHSVIIKHLDDKSCTLVGKRKDTGDTAEITFDMNDAKRAGKSYDKHPKSMLFARALSMLKRFLFPDVLTKIYEKDEVDEMVKEDEERKKNQGCAPTNWSDVKPLYIEEKKVISSAQAIELSDLLSNCSEAVSKNILGYIKKEYKIEMIDDLPLDEFEKYKELCKNKADEYQKKLAAEYQKKLAEAEMNNVNEEEVLV